MTDTKNSPTESTKTIRIGLVIPYNSGNLGDAAIIESAQVQVLRLFPEAKLVLLVVDCARVAALHNIETFPLSGVQRSFYYMPKQTESTIEATAAASSEDLRPSTVQQVRSALKTLAVRIPFALPTAKFIRDTLQFYKQEIDHIQSSRKLIRSFDGLIFCGSGQFDDEYGGPWGHPYAMFKLVFLAKSYRVPSYFIGVGVCETIYSLSGFFYRRTLPMAARVSLRDPGSLQILRKLGIRRELTLSPDLAFGLYRTIHEAKNGEREAVGRRTIGLSPISYGRPGSWPIAKPAVFDRYWSEFTELAASLLEAGYSVTLFVTDEADFILTQMLYEQIQATTKTKDRLTLLPQMKFKELSSILGTFEAVIASRLHGVVLTHIHKVPVLGIAHQRKVRAHLEDMGQERFCLDFETFTAPEALLSFERLLSERTSVLAELDRACIDRCVAVEKEFEPVGTAVTAKAAANRPT
jgi:polysaccharide pyruvyl transferase WcaK-like protein